MYRLINDSLRASICEQIGHELYNANLYLYICAFLRNKGLDNTAKHFEGQHAEETEHAKEFVKLLTDLDAPLTIPEIDEVSITFNTIWDIAKAYVDREVLTTSCINEIKNLAMVEGSAVVEEKMREMISKQQKEYEEATGFMDKAELMPEWWQWAIYDGSSG